MSSDTNIYDWVLGVGQPTPSFAHDLCHVRVSSNDDALMFLLWRN